MPDTMDPGQARALALLQAMGPMQEAGLQRSASPAGAIAKNLIPIFGAIIQGKLYEQQAAMQQRLEEAKISRMGGDPEQRAATLAKTKAETELVQARTKAAGQPKSTGLSDNQILLGALQGDPTAKAMWEAKQQAKQQQAIFGSNLVAQRTEQIRQINDSLKEQERLAMPASRAPEYRGKVIFDRNTLTSPSGVAVKDLESPDSPYVALAPNDARTVRGSKQIIQQLDRMEQLIPEVLPKSRLGIPITLAESTFSGPVSGKAAELDRLSAFENLKGIRDFLANGRVNQTEVKNVGGVSRMTDSQTTALAKIQAMRDLVTGSVGALGLNPDVLVKGGAKEAQPSSMTFDFKDKNMNAVFENLKAQYPDKTADELVDIYLKNKR